MTTIVNPLVQSWSLIIKGDLQLGALSEHLGQYQHELLSYASAREFESFVKRQLGSDDMAAVAGYRDVLSWLTVSGGRDSPVFQPKYSKEHRAFRFLLFMDLVRRRIHQHIHESLEPRFNAGGLPEKGVLLAFTNRIEYAYLIGFDFGNGRPEIQVIDRIRRPRALFDLSHFPELSSQRAKNAAKTVLSGGHKIILHRGVLTHVDRLLDKDVFGPTIDTILLAEEVLEGVEPLAPERILEIGCGNGHIISTAAARIGSVKNAVFIDVNPHATTCTLRNLNGNLSQHRRVAGDALANCFGVTGPFSSDLPLGQTFDLVVSNPPYISIPPGFEKGQVRAARVAVSGTELLEEIVRSVRKLLSPTGRLLLMTSSTSEQAVLRALPSGFVAEKGQSFDRLSVPFDVEDALDNQAWISWLEGAALVKRGTGGFVHDLIPVWIRRSQS